jgi:hypothetical protein
MGSRNKRFQVHPKSLLVFLCGLLIAGGTLWDVESDHLATVSVSIDSSEERGDARVLNYCLDHRDEPLHVIRDAELEYRQIVAAVARGEGWTPLDKSMKLVIPDQAD